MRKYLFIITFMALLLSLSFNCLAVTNRYTFSDVWNSSVFSKSYILTSSSNSPGKLVSAPLLDIYQGNNVTSYGYNDTVSFSGIEYDGNSSNSFDISIPFGIYLNEYNYMDYYLYLLSSESDISLTATAITSTGKSVSITPTITDYTRGTLKGYTMNSFGGIDSVNDIYSSSAAHQIRLYLDPSDNITIDYINISIVFNSSIDSFVLGAVGSTDIVSLPDNVENFLSTLSNRINLTNNRILQLINELKLTNSKIDEVLSALSSASAGTTVLTQFLQTPTQDQTAVTENLEQLVEEAKQELEEIKEVISSVTAPTSDDLISVNTDGVDSALGIISDDQTQQVFSSIFDKLYFLPGLILSVLAIATLGYVLFGKKA